MQSPAELFLRYARWWRIIASNRTDAERDHHLQWAEKLESMARELQPAATATARIIPWPKR